MLVSHFSWDTSNRYENFVKFFKVAKETKFEFWGFIFVTLAVVMSGFRLTMTQFLLQKESMVLTEYILISVTSAIIVTIAGVVKEAVTIL
ncbi:hypothetical protein CASFOL_013875 [Castilleja foliolosa]|uniref:Uncharacterized protein n=1 Tax=Castilleja foliolosa TaxID=1961234 RepID=A0ABD3DQB1_9LAMI